MSDEVMVTRRTPRPWADSARLCAASSSTFGLEKAGRVRRHVRFLLVSVQTKTSAVLAVQISVANSARRRVSALDSPPTGILGRVHTNRRAARTCSILRAWGSLKDSSNAYFLPREQGKVSLTNFQVLNAFLHVAEHGCKWRGLPARLDKWHTIYTRMNRWSRSGVLDRVFEALQQAQILRVRIQVISLDATIVKMHPDGAGALKSRTPCYRKLPRRVDHQDSSGCRRCSNGCELCPVARAGPQCRRGPQVARSSGRDAAADSPDRGQGL
jgi:transposase